MEAYDKKGKLITFTHNEGDEDFSELEETMMDEDDGIEDTDDVLEEEEVKQE